MGKQFNPRFSKKKYSGRQRKKKKPQGRSTNFFSSAKQIAPFSPLFFFILSPILPVATNELPIIPRQQQQEEKKKNYVINDPTKGFDWLFLFLP